MSQQKNSCNPVELFRLFLTFILCMSSCSLFAQKGFQIRSSGKYLFEFTGFTKTDSGIIKTNYRQGVCRNVIITTEFMPYKKMEFVKLNRSNDKVGGPALLVVHGNVSYNYLYRSYIDTPFAQTDMMQHLVQTNLNFLIKDKYPVTVTVTHRNSNSPYFRNYSDVSVQFNQRQLINDIKSKLIAKVDNTVGQSPLQTIKNEFADKQNRLLQLQNWINNPARAQELVGEKEELLKSEIRNGLRNRLESTELLQDSVYNQYSGTFDKVKNRLSAGSHLYESFRKFKGGMSNKFTANNINEFAKGYQSTDTASSLADSNYAKKYQQRKLEADKMKSELDSIQKKMWTVEKKVKDSIYEIKAQINRIVSRDSLYGFMKSHKIPKDSLTKLQHLLLSVKKISVGRTWVDYSELTVKNLSLVGVNIELNPDRFYFAAAVGKVSYRFRDFIYKNNDQPSGQQLYLLRAGIGRIENSNIIVTFYNGRKSSLNNTNNFATPLQKIMGLSIEGTMRINKDNYLVAEVAKSSYASNSTIIPGSSELLNKVFNFNTNTNNAYSLKLFSQIPSTDTKINGYYRKIGENFQSFNLYTTNTNQDAWMARVNQQLWNHKFSLDAAIRKNDFQNPLAIQSFSSQTIFKSLQATLRLPKYPFISLGYYPSSQLSILNGNILMESQYNTMNATVSHNYTFRKLAMNSNLLLTRFYNNSSDTGFLYYNATSVTLNHSIFLGHLSLQTTTSISNQQFMRLFTLEQQASYQFANICTLGGGIKCIRVNNTASLFGGNAVLSMDLKNWGRFQLNYDKTYLPDNRANLKSVDMGRMSYYKEF